MKKLETRLPGVYLIEPQVFGDRRGYFMETYSTAAFAEMGIDTVFVQDNQSFTAQKMCIRDRPKLKVYVTTVADTCQASSELAARLANDFEKRIRRSGEPSMASRNKQG